MTPELFANLGIAGVALYIIYVMLKYFMESLNKKDDYLTRKDTQITQLVEGHNRTVDKFKKHVELCNTNFIDLTKQANAHAAEQTEVLERLIVKIDGITNK